MHAGVEACLQELTEIPQAVYHVLTEQGEERLWVGSMPRPAGRRNHSIGRYGSSNVGRARHLPHGPRAAMAGACKPSRASTTTGRCRVSPASATDLIRNFRRHGWLILYLFGASPALCSSFVEGRDHGLQPFMGKSPHRPHATSLRMGPLGYQSDAQASIRPSYNSLRCYANSLQDALTRPHPAYEGHRHPHAGGIMPNSPPACCRRERVLRHHPPSAPSRSGERPLHPRCAERGSSTSRCD